MRYQPNTKKRNQQRGNWRKGEGKRRLSNRWTSSERSSSEQDFATFCQQVACPGKRRARQRSATRKRGGRGQENGSVRASGGREPSRRELVVVVVIVVVGKVIFIMANANGWSCSCCCCCNLILRFQNCNFEHCKGAKIVDVGNENSNIIEKTI